MTKNNPCLDASNMDRKAHSDKYAITIEGDSMTVQGDPGEYDLNVMMARFGITGKMPENPRIPMYGDFTHITDYRSAMHAIAEANQKFMEMTPEVRAFFSNDPQNLLEAHDQLAQNPEMLNKFKDLGLLKEAPPAPPAPPTAQVDPKTGTT